MQKRSREECVDKQPPKRQRGMINWCIFLKVDLPRKVERLLHDHLIKMFGEDKEVIKNLKENILEMDLWSVGLTADDSQIVTCAAYMKSDGCLYFLSTRKENQRCGYGKLAALKLATAAHKSFGAKVMYAGVVGGCESVPHKFYSNWPVWKECGKKERDADEKARFVMNLVERKIFVRLMSGSDLLNRLEEEKGECHKGTASSQTHTSVFDCRPSVHYGKETILGAVNLEVPVRRVDVNPQKCTFQVILQEVIKRAQNNSNMAFLSRKSQDVVLFDSSSKRLDNRSPVCLLSELLAEEGSVRQVFVLKGGYTQFSQEHPDFCRRSDEPTQVLNLTPVLSETSGPPIPVIEGKLYLGNKTHAASQELLTELNITHVVNCTEQHEVRNYFPSCYEYLRISLLDSPEGDLCSVISEANDFISQATEDSACCLVHCYFGRSRSPSIALAYLMEKNKWTLKQALDHLKGKSLHLTSNGHEPNSWFLKQLEDYGNVQLNKSF